MSQSKINRRQFLRLNSAALAGLAVGPGLFTKSKADTGRITENTSPGFYRFSFGEMEITVLSDGHFEYSPDYVTIDDPVEIQAYNAEPELRKEYFRSRRLPSDHIPLQTSPVLIDSGSQRTLIDCGFGTGEQIPPTAGHLGHSLEAAGIAAESIDSVLLTHAHPDHMGGFLNPEDGTPVFPEAELVISEKEYEFWMSDQHASNQNTPFVPEMTELFANAARGLLQSADDRIRTVSGEEEIAGGIRSIPSPGHTPGHICCAVESRGRQLLLTGDAIVFSHISLEYPEWQFFGDLDPKEAARSRKRLLDRATADEMFMLGFHFPFPGLGYAVKHDDAYRWQQAVSAL